MKNKSNAFKPLLELTESGFTHSTFLIFLFVFFTVFGIFKFVGNHVSADSPRIVSGISGQCMDLNTETEGPIVDVWKCNNTTAQVWSVSTNKITHGINDCLAVKDDSIEPNTKIILSKCSDTPGQVWLRDQDGFYNPNSNLCLSADSSSQLYLNTCNELNSDNEKWNLSAQSLPANICKGSKGGIVACNAVKEWTDWQSSSSNHNALLNEYTDGAPYEEWCADFVSYVYKESGYPFTNGETDGWNENNANNIENMGFTIHQADSGYIPKTGDVAYFNYDGGHVEIVIVGGKKPTFIYGNSATIDPSTGNGQMMANTITSDGSFGQVTYYLTPQ